MKVEHVAFWVKDLEAMKVFYTTYFDVVANEKYFNPKKSFSSYFLSFSSGSRIELMHRPDISERLEDAMMLGLTHIAISLGSEQQVDALTKRMQEDGISIVGKPRRTGDGYYESVVMDPEGNQIELTV